MRSRMAYHLQFLAGGSDVARDSAEIGYQLAAQYGPGESLPWVQLGRLRSDAGQHESAGKDYARAVELQPGNADALYGLATSSYPSRHRDAWNEGSPGGSGSRGHCGD